MRLAAPSKTERKAGRVPYLSRCPHAARKVNPVMLAAVGVALKKVCSEQKGCELFL